MIATFSDKLYLFMMLRLIISLIYIFVFQNASKPSSLTDRGLYALRPLASIFCFDECFIFIQTSNYNKSNLF